MSGFDGDFKRSTQHLLILRGVRRVSARADQSQIGSSYCSHRAPRRRATRSATIFSKEGEPGSVSISCQSSKAAHKGNPAATISSTSGIRALGSLAVFGIASSYDLEPRRGINAISDDRRAAPRESGATASGSTRKALDLAEQHELVARLIEHRESRLHAGVPPRHPRPKFALSVIVSNRA
jgi:hypothetical protein